MPKDKAADRGRKGGIASGVTRRKQKTIRETLKLLLEMPVGGHATGTEAITVAMLEKALAGDVRAFEAIRDSVGEKPSEKLDMISSDGSMSQVPTKIVLVAGDDNRNDKTTTKTD